MRELNDIMAIRQLTAVKIDPPTPPHVIPPIGVRVAVARIPDALTPPSLPSHPHTPTESH